MNKVVLITGASRGIGKSATEIYAKNGYNVVINYKNNKEKAETLGRDLEEKYQIKTFTRLDVVVNNAGIAIDSLVQDKNKESFHKTLDTNLIGTFLVSKYASKYMDKGSIVNISSTNGINSYYPFSLDYDTSKAGVNILTKDLAVEFAPNIRVNAVAPGWVNTEMNQLLDNEFKQKEIDKIALSRFAESIEIAKVIYFLSSEDASYINGEIIVVDGGRI